MSQPIWNLDSFFEFSSYRIKHYNLYMSFVFVENNSECSEWEVIKDHFQNNEIIKLKSPFLYFVLLIISIPTLYFLLRIFLISSNHKILCISSAGQLAVCFLDFIVCYQLPSESYIPIQNLNMFVNKSS